jgi:hypothetical protein
MPLPGKGSGVRITNQSLDDPFFAYVLLLIDNEQTNREPDELGQSTAFLVKICELFPKSQRDSLGQYKKESIG